MKLSELSKLAKLPHTKVKRYAREFLGPDREATMRSGIARELTGGEAWRVYLGGFMVSDLRLLSIEAQQILIDLWPWIEKKQLLPERGEQAPHWTVSIYPAEDKAARKKGFMYLARGVFRAWVEAGHEYEEFVTEPIVTDFFKNAINGVDSNENIMSVLPISSLLNIYRLKVAGQL